MRAVGDACLGWQHPEPNEEPDGPLPLLVIRLAAHAVLIWGSGLVAGVATAVSLATRWFEADQA